MVEYRLKLPDGIGSEPVFLVDTLNSNVPPSGAIILKYYGDNPPLDAFGLVGYDRYIFQRPNGSYVIIPDTPKGRKLVVRA